MGWIDVQNQLNPQQQRQLVEEVSRELAGVPMQILQRRPELNQRAEQALQTVIRRANLPLPDGNQLQAIMAAVVPGTLVVALPLLCAQFIVLHLTRCAPHSIPAAPMYLAGVVLFIVVSAFLFV